MNLELLRNAIDSSEHIVCLQGYGMTEDSGCSNFRNQQSAYEVEMDLGHSPDELFSAVYYNTRPAQFYEYYKKYILTHVGSPGEDYSALERLQKNGKLRAIVTGSIFSLPQRAGCRNVVEVHGSIYNNYCPKCKRPYSMEYVKSSNGVPMCGTCKTPVRPGIQLMGETIENQIFTIAANEVAKADLLLVLGCHLSDPLVRNFTQYLEEGKIILINKAKHYSDAAADYTYYGNTKEVLPQIIPEPVLEQSYRIG